MNIISAFFRLFQRRPPKPDGPRRMQFDGHPSATAAMRGGFRNRQDYRTPWGPAEELDKANFRGLIDRDKQGMQ